MGHISYITAIKPSLKYGSLFSIGISTVHTYLQQIVNYNMGDNPTFHESKYMHTLIQDRKIEFPRPDRREKRLIFQVNRVVQGWYAILRVI